MCKLDELKEAIIDANWLDTALVVVKYQDFKSKVAIKQMPKFLSESTRRNYFEAGVKYIKTQQKWKGGCKAFYAAIDKTISDCVQPLTPRAEDARRVYKTRKKNYQSKDAVPPIKKVMESLNSVASTNFTYGVQIDDVVKIFNNSADAKLFLTGVTFAGRVGQLVTVEKASNPL